MSDAVSPIAVRELIALSVIVDKKECRISLRKTKDQSLACFFKDRLATLERKLTPMTGRSYHSVVGVPELQDDDIAAIFKDLIQIPYENGWMWMHALKEKAGVIKLEAARSAAADVPQPASHGAKTRSSKLTRVPSAVRCGIAEPKC